MFTQGLATNENAVFVSSGKYGESFIGKINLKNGEVYDRFMINDNYFAEGITLVDKSVIVATWKENTLFELNKERYITENPKSHYVDGEIWGLTSNNDLVYMSDGSSRIYHFKITNPMKNEFINITFNNEPLNLINEIEYANGYIYANVWYSNNIYKIDITNEKVVKVYDLEDLGERFNIPELIDNNFAVLNGIAHLSDNLFYITGKNWPVILKMELE